MSDEQAREYAAAKAVQHYIQAMAMMRTEPRLSGINDALKESGLTITRRGAVTIGREIIDRAVQDGFYAARKRWNEKLREYNGELDALDAWGVEVTAITDSVMAAIAAADPEEEMT